MVLPGWTTAPVTIAIFPQPYVGITADMRAALTIDRTWRKRQHDTSTDYVPSFQGPKRNLQAFRVDGGQGIVEWLERNYFDGPNETKNTYGKELLHLWQAGEKAAAAGEAYLNPRGKDGEAEQED